MERIISYKDELQNIISVIKLEILNRFLDNNVSYKEDTSCNELEIS